MVVYAQPSPSCGVQGCMWLGSRGKLPSSSPSHLSSISCATHAGQLRLFRLRLWYLALDAYMG